MQKAEVFSSAFVFIQGTGSLAIGFARMCAKIKKSRFGHVRTRLSPIVWDSLCAKYKEIPLWPCSDTIINP